MKACQVIRARCLKCEQNFTLLCRDLKRDFTEGEELELSCKDVKRVYTKACGAKQPLRFQRVQGQREPKKGEKCVIEDLKKK